MAGEVQAHETSTSLVQADLGEVYAGMDMVLQVKVACSSACDLRDKVVRILAQDASNLKEVKLAAFDGATTQTEEFIVKSPVAPGEYTWIAAFPEQEYEGDCLQASEAPFSFFVKPHAVSMAVWDVASPLIIDTGFKLKVGVKCSAGCKLAGEIIEICDHNGAKVATGTLGGTPFADTDDLYWAEVELDSPATKGIYRWEAALAKPSLEPPHNGASFKFGFGAVERPEYAVTISVVDQATKAPVANAHVMLRPYSGHTDDTGVARLETAGGKFMLNVMEDRHESFQASVNVTGDTTILAELIPALYKEDYRGNLWKVERKKAMRSR